MSRSIIKRSLLLVEAHNLAILLLESRLEYLEKTFLPKFEKMAPKLLNQAIHVIPGLTAESYNAKAVFDYIVAADPDPTKKNSQWLISLVLKGKLPLEDLDKATSDLKLFNVVKRQMPPEQRDVNKYKSLADLYTTIEHYETTKKSQRAIDRELDQKMHAQAEVVYNGPDYKIIVPKTQEASCYFGVNTRWCTAATKTRNYFNHYNNSGSLYIILDKKSNQRWQFHFGTASMSPSFMDESDQPINIKAFLQDHPKIKQIFDHLEDDYEELGVVNGLLALKTDHGIVFKKARGPFARPNATIAAKDGIIASLHASLNLGLGDSDKITQELIGVLNRSGLTPRDADVFVDYDVFYVNGKFGDLREVGKKVVQSDGTHWMGLETKADNGIEHRYFDLISDSYDIRVMRASIDDGALYLDKPIMDDERIGDRVLDLIANQKSAIKSLGREGEFELDTMTNAQIARLVKIAPQIAPIAAIYKLYGNTKEVRERIDNILDEAEISYVGWEKTDKEEREQAELDVGEKPSPFVMVVEKFKNVEELIDDHGSDFLKRVNGEFNGVGDFSFDADPDNDTLEELFFSLSPEYQQWIGNYIAHEYGTDEDEEEIDPTDAKQVWRVIDDHEDDEVKSSVLRWAAQDGYRVGAESEMYDDYIKALKNAHDDQNYVALVFSMRDDHILHDDEIKAIVGIEKLVELCDNRNDLDIVSNDGWFTNEIEIEEPNYGWSGYDKASAIVRAEELVHEHLDKKFKPKKKG